MSWLRGATASPCLIGQEVVFSGMCISGNVELWKQLGILVRTQHCRYELVVSHRGLVQGKDASKLFIKTVEGVVYTGMAVHLGL